MPLPYPPYGVPPRPSTNGFAIGSLVAGIVCCLPPLGLVLGLIALAQIKRKGQDGRGLATAGTVLSVISTMLMTVAFATGGVGAAWDGFREAVNESARSRSTLDLRTGQCFNTPGATLEEETESVEVVPCTGPHDAEVSGTFTLHGFDSWPGETAIQSQAGPGCEDRNNTYTLDWWAVPEHAETYYHMPSKRSWRFGDRTITCTFAATEGKLEASVRSDSTTLDPGQLAYLKTEAAVDEVMFQEPEETFDDSPAPNRAWARQVSKELAAQAAVLRGGTWTPSARTAVEARAKEYDMASDLWERASKAEHPGDFYSTRYEASDALQQATEIAIRSALGLTTVPPAYLNEDLDDPESEEDDPESEESEDL
ncbi:DUF4190 domain-containing protein [Streptomyces sp. NPDC001514]